MLQRDIMGWSAHICLLTQQIFLHCCAFFHEFIVQLRKYHRIFSSFRSNGLFARLYHRSLPFLAQRRASIISHCSLADGAKTMEEKKHAQEDDRSAWLDGDDDDGNGDDGVIHRFIGQKSISVSRDDRTRWPQTPRQ